MIIGQSFFKSPLGILKLSVTESALVGAQFVTKAGINEGSSWILHLVEKELSLYFERKLTQFTTPILLLGTPFQKIVWQALLTIPYGDTTTYKTVAERVGRPKACRAVAQANRANRLSIIVPCHRVIYASGKMGGYAFGIERKAWFLNHEQNK